MFLAPDAVFALNSLLLITSTMHTLFQGTKHNDVYEETNLYLISHHFKIEIATITIN